MADNPRLEELKRRVQQDPASIAFAALAEEYRRSGRFQEAIATCTAGLHRHPSYLSAHVTLGRALIEVGRYEDAAEELQFVLRLAPENLAAIRGLAEIHHRRREDAADEQPRAVVPLARPAAITPAPAPVPVIPASLPQLIEVALPPAIEVAPPVAPVPAAPVVAAPPAVAPLAAAPLRAAPHPALSGLESFLSAIVRAREGVRS